MRRRKIYDRIFPEQKFSRVLNRRPRPDTPPTIPTRAIGAQRLRHPGFKRLLHGGLDQWLQELLVGRYIGPNLRHGHGGPRAPVILQPPDLP
jgi:hypothetical protein